MVTKLDHVKYVFQTAIDNIVVFSYLNKISIFDIAKRNNKIDIKIRDVDFLGQVEYQNYVGFNGTNPCVVDLEKLEIIKTFSAQDIVKRFLLDSKYKSNLYYVEPTMLTIVDIASEKLLCHIGYKVFDEASVVEKHSVLCTFSFPTWKFLNYENTISNYLHYRYDRQETKYPFLEYDTDAANAVLAPLKIKKKPNFRVLLYNKKYNVIFFLNGDFCYSYYLDADDEKTINKVTEEDNIFSQSNFDAEDYIRQNGLTPNVLNHLSDEDILDGGYFWALDRIDRKAEELKLSSENILNTNLISDEEKILYAIGLFETYLNADGIDQYFASGDSKEFKCLINVLKLIGADATAKIIADGEKITNSSDKSTQFDKFERLEEKLNEDYIGMAIKYIKKSKGLN